MRDITIDLPNDYEGKVTATIVSSTTAKSSHRAVLYLHGYIDYFFQTHMAEHFNRSGFNFYALDLRKYGRSMLATQHPNYCRSMSEYYSEIDTAIEHIKADGNSDITLLGHSTGGLLASIYCAQGLRRNLVDRLVLNSPFFEFNTCWFKRKIAIPISGVVSLVLPYAHKSNELSPHYFSSVHRSEHGEWNFSAELKPKLGIPLYFAWLRAVQSAQRRVQHGLGLQIPILVMHSARSWKGAQWSDQAMHADAVLNVRHIAKYAPKLGSKVEVESVEGGLHDLVLSQKEVREQVLCRIVSWIESKNRSIKDKN